MYHLIDKHYAGGKGGVFHPLLTSDPVENFLFAQRRHLLSLGSNRLLIRSIM